MPDPARTPNQTTAHSFSGTQIGIHSDQPVRVTVETPKVEFWTMVLDSFIDRDLPQMTELAAVKVMLVLFRKRDRFSNLAKIKRPDLISATGLKSKGAVSAALKTLRSMKLVDDLGDDTFVVAPGIEFAGSRGSPQRTPVLDREQKFSTENAVSSDRVRAPEPPDPEKDRHESKPEAGAEAESRGLFARGSGAGGAGVPDRRTPAGVRAVAAGGDLFVLDRTARLRAALEASGIREPSRSALMSLSDLTPEEVLECAKKVMSDQAIVEPAPVIAYRLFKRRGMVMPKALGRRNRFSDESFAVIRGLQMLQSGRGGAGGQP